MKIKGLSLIIIVLLVSTSMLSTTVFAGVEPDEIDFFPQNPQMGMMVNLNYTPANEGCENAAPSYLKPNIPVRLIENIWFGDIVGVDDLDYLDLLLYFDTLLNAVKSDAYRLTSQAGGGNNGMILAQGTLTTLQEGALAQTTGSYVCLPVHEGLAMFWEVNVNGQIGWLMESIRWQNVILELHSPEPQGNNAPMPFSPVIAFQPIANNPNVVQFNPVQGQLMIKPVTQLSSMEAYYLTPHVYEPSEGLMGGSQIAQIECDGTAPSRLTIGEKAFYMGHFVTDGYPEDWAESLYGSMVNYARFNLGNNPTMPTYISLPWHQTSLIDLSGDAEQLEELFEQWADANSNAEEDDEPQDDDEPQEEPSIISDQNFLKVPIPVGQVIDTVVAGPLCTRRTEVVKEILGYENGEFIEAVYQYSEVFVWWQLDLNLLGMDLGSVWLPESVTRHAPQGRADFYLLTPDTFVSTAPNTYAEPVWLPQDIRPILSTLHGQSMCDGILPSTLFAGSLAQPNGSALNLRTAPNGAIIGRVEANEPFTVFGESVCWGGYRWRETSRGGWIAETSRTTALIVPAIQNVVPSVTEMPQSAPITPSAPIESVPTEFVPVPTETPTQPPRPTCDVITGANC
jgi:hypothetical protein